MLRVGLAEEARGCAGKRALAADAMGRQEGSGRAAEARLVAPGELSSDSSRGNRAGPGEVSVGPAGSGSFPSAGTRPPGVAQK